MSLEVFTTMQQQHLNRLSERCSLGKNLSKMQAPWSRGGVLPRSKTVLSAVKPPRDPPRQLPILRALFDEGACILDNFMKAHIGGAMLKSVEAACSSRN